MDVGTRFMSLFHVRRSCRTQPFSCLSLRWCMKIILVSSDPPRGRACLAGRGKTNNGSGSKYHISARTVCFHVFTVFVFNREQCYPTECGVQPQSAWTCLLASHACSVSCLYRGTVGNTDTPAGGRGCTLPLADRSG